MPSDRKQINVRADDATLELVAELIPVVSAAIGLTVNQSDLFRLGMNELKKKYLDAAASPPVTPPEPGGHPPAAKKAAKRGKK